MYNNSFEKDHHHYNLFVREANLIGLYLKMCLFKTSSSLGDNYVPEE